MRSVGPDRSKDNPKPAQAPPSAPAQRDESLESIPVDRPERMPVLPPPTPVTDSVQPLSAFQMAAKALVDANKGFFTDRTLTSVAHSNLREAALSQAMIAMATELGANLRQPLHLNSNAEFYLIALPDETRVGFRDACGSFGEAFVEVLNRHHPRCGVQATAQLLPENGWCYLNHFNAEAMVMGHFAATLPPLVPTGSPVPGSKESVEDLAQVFDKAYNRDSRVALLVDYEAMVGTHGEDEAQAMLSDRTKELISTAYTFCD